MGEGAETRYQQWLKLEEGTPDGPGNLTLYMLILNGLGVALHVGALGLEFAMGVRTNMWVYITNLKVDRVYYANSEMYRWNPVFYESEQLYITWLALSVHFMALASHVAVCVSLALSYRTGWRGASKWYLWGLCHCRAWWRWAEYAGSATAMIVFLAVITGIREDEKVIALATLCLTTMLFGWMTEVHSSALIEPAGAHGPVELGWVPVARGLVARPRCGTTCSGTCPSGDVLVDPRHLLEQQGGAAGEQRGVAGLCGLQRLRLAGAVQHVRRDAAGAAARRLRALVVLGGRGVLRVSQLHGQGVADPARDVQRADAQQPV